MQRTATFGIGHPTSLAVLVEQVASPLLVAHPAPVLLEVDLGTDLMTTADAEQLKTLISTLIRQFTAGDASRRRIDDFSLSNLHMVWNWRSLTREAMPKHEIHCCRFPQRHSAANLIGKTATRRSGRDDRVAVQQCDSQSGLMGMSETRPSMMNSLISQYL